jgi:hypothetical protein
MPPKPANASRRAQARHTFTLTHGDGSSGGELALFQQSDDGVRKVLGEGGAIVDAQEEEEEEEWVTDEGSGSDDDEEEGECDASDGEDPAPLPLPG